MVAIVAGRCARRWSPVAGTTFPVIRCERVVKRFGDVVALDELDVEVHDGEIVGYLGPNGAGKSTTIRILLDLARPDSGKVSVLGVDPRAGGPALRRRIGYVPGELRLDERLTVEETLRSWGRVRGGVDQAYVARLCERFDLDPGRHTRGLSSGNRRKVGVVGAFMSRPELLILDEPTSGLDPLVQAEFQELVEETRDEGRTVFLSSHVLSEVQRVADRVVVIRDGRSLFTGAVEALRRAARQPFTVWFSAAVPSSEELQAVAGVAEVDVRGNEVRGVVEGSPSPLLALLARYPVEHLLMPELELEDAFLRLYGAEASAP
jgi:ABC-2 type transport system ATP-binding protein